MSKNECKIQMLDLYFSKYDFEQVRGEENNEYSTSFEIEYAISSADKTKVKVCINAAISNENKSLNMNLQTIGIFQIDKIDIDESTYEHLIKANTVAIMFPFIRSQISLLTTQPGIMPVMLPPININALIEAQEDS